MIIGPNVGLYGYVNLLLVVHNLNQHVAILVLVEYKLKVRGHRSCLEVAPMLVDTSRWFNGYVKVLYLKQSQQRNYVAVMSKA